MSKQVTSKAPAHKKLPKPLLKKIRQLKKQGKSNETIRKLLDKEWPKD